MKVDAKTEITGRAGFGRYFSLGILPGIAAVGAMALGAPIGTITLGTIFGGAVGAGAIAVLAGAGVAVLAGGVVASGGGAAVAAGVSALAGGVGVGVISVAMAVAIAAITAVAFAVGTCAYEDIVIKNNRLLAKSESPRLSPTRSAFGAGSGVAASCALAFAAATHYYPGMIPRQPATPEPVVETVRANGQTLFGGQLRRDFQMEKDITATAADNGSGEARYVLTVPSGCTFTC